VNDQVKARIAALNEKEVYGRKIVLKEAEKRGKDSSGNFQYKWNCYLKQNPLRLQRVNIKFLAGVLTQLITHIVLELALHTAALIIFFHTAVYAPNE
jgi:hypothetical protein